MLNMLYKGGNVLKASKKVEVSNNIGNNWRKKEMKIDYKDHIQILIEVQKQNWTEKKNLKRY